MTKTATAKAYEHWRLSIDFDEISYGSGGIALFPLERLKEMQVGYSVNSKGESLVGNRAGDWHESWLVIGHDTLEGNPIFIDLDSFPSQVMAAVHGQGAWNPECISTTLEGFSTALQEIKIVSTGRANPVELEKNPLPKRARNLALKRIAKANPGADIYYWELLLEEGDDDET